MSRGWTPIDKNPRVNYAKVDRELQRDNRKWPVALKAVPPQDWPVPAGSGALGRLVGVWRSQGFLVQVFEERGFIRLAVNRASIDIFGKFRDGISWDDLQRLKREAGYGDRHMVELYPPDGDVVNASNMRHLWLLKEPPPYGWRIVTPVDRPASGGGDV